MCLPRDVQCCCCVRVCVRACVRACVSFLLLAFSVELSTYNEKYTR